MSISMVLHKVCALVQIGSFLVYNIDPASSKDDPLVASATESWIEKIADLGVIG